MPWLPRMTCVTLVATSYSLFTNPEMELLSIVMLLVTGSFGRMDTMDLLGRAVSCMIWEAVLALIAWLAVNIILIVRFDSKGDLRKNKTRR